MKEEIKNPDTSVEYDMKIIETYSVSCKLFQR